MWKVIEYLSGREIASYKRRTIASLEIRRQASLRLGCYMEFTPHPILVSSCLFCHKVLTGRFVCCWACMADRDASVPTLQAQMV